MPIDYRRIYRDRAPDYDRLVSAEDRDGNIQSALQPFLPADQNRIVDVGTGTGRLTRLVAPFASQIIAVDVARPMLAVARTRLASEGRRILWMVGDGRALPIRSGWADVAIAGWAFGHFTEWSANTWQHDIGAAIDEMCRAVRPGAAVVVLETLGTGTTKAAPPSDGLRIYYEWLENTGGFSRHVAQTDYEFDSVEEAVDLTRFFFGEGLAGQVRQMNQRIVPEWTGVWTKRVV